MLYKIVRKIITMFQRRNYIKYARTVGVKVGENCRFVDNPSWGTEPYLISIGNHVLISGSVTFLTHDGATWLFREQAAYKDTYKFGPISIGDNCFIGYRSIILPNVHIGNDSVVAAGSVVSKSIPSGEVWGGVPAKFIMKTQDYANKCFENRLPYDPQRIKDNKKEELISLFNLK